MDESPAKAKSEGKQVQTLKESFGNRYNMKFVLLLYLELQWDKVLFGILQFYAMNFMKTVMSIDSSQVDTLLGVALILGTPFFVFLVG
jgi:hypothetical protein